MESLREICEKLKLLDKKKDHGKITRPQHQVTITKPFYMGAHEVTQQQYETVMGTNPSSVKGGNLPVETVSWNDAYAFCAKLSGMEKTSYSLPTEAQWEYACRAGTETAFFWGEEPDGQYAWMHLNDNGQVHDVGTREPNALGLYDMSGNVWEWCSDWFGRYKAGAQIDPTPPKDIPCRVTRGGAWMNDGCWSATRSIGKPALGKDVVGFRVSVILPRTR